MLPRLAQALSRAWSELLVHQPRHDPQGRVTKRRGRDLNPRRTQEPETVFETAAFDRSATPPRDAQGTVRCWQSPLYETVTFCFMPRVAWPSTLQYSSYLPALSVTVNSALPPGEISFVLSPVSLIARSCGILPTFFT